MRFKPYKKWGKSRWLFPLLCFIFNTSIPAQWQNLFSTFANFRTIPVLGPEQVQSERGQFELDYQFDDVYRKKIFDRQALLINQKGIQALIFYPLRIKSHSQLVMIKARLFDISANNHNDWTAVSGFLRGDGFDHSLAWASTGKNGMIGLQGRYKQSENTANLAIKSYPVSEDHNLNKFFLDWLPLTFGNPITNKSRFRLSEINGWGSTLLNQENRLQLSLSRVQSANRLTFQYVNTTNKAALNGPRLLDIPVDFDISQISLALFRSNRSISPIEVSYIISDLKFSTDNHPPSFIDFKSLGQGSFRHQGFSVTISYSRKGYQFATGLSSSSFRGDLVIQTPVLGYIILPIAHKANGHINQGQAFSQKLLFRTDTKIGNTEISMSADYIHSRYFLQIIGQAHLEFDLISAPIDYPIRIDANILDIQAKIQRRIKNYLFSYSVRQLIPVIKRLDESPIRFIEQIPGKKITQRGGASHQFRITYEF